MPLGFTKLFGKSPISDQPQNTETFSAAQLHDSNPNKPLPPTPVNGFSTRGYATNSHLEQVNEMGELNFANVAQLETQTMPRMPPAGASNARAGRSTPAHGVNAHPSGTSKRDTSLADMLGKAKELGLPLIVVNVTNNCSSPMSSLPKVDVSLPGAHVLVNEEHGGNYQASTMLGCTPAPIQPLELDLLDMSNDRDCDNAGGQRNEDPANGRAGALSPAPRSACPSICVPSISALSTASDDEEGFEERDEINSPAHYLRLIKSVDEAMIQAVSDSHDAMRSHGIPEDRTAYLKTCKGISTALELIIAQLRRWDQEIEEEHRFRRAIWYSKFKERLDSLERNLGNLKTCTESIQQRLKQAEAPNRPLTLDTFDRLNTRLKEYLAKFESINAKLESTFDRMVKDLFHPQLDNANESVRRARLDYEEARELYHSTKAHRARLQRHLTSSSRRGGRQSALLS